MIMHWGYSNTANFGVDIEHIMAADRPYYHDDGSS